MKYEDLIENPKIISENLYEFVGFDQNLQNSITPFWNQKLNVSLKTSDFEDKKKYYYDTIRGSDFDPHRWRKELKMEEIENMQKNPACMKIMTQLGYKMY